MNNDIHNDSDNNDSNKDNSNNNNDNNNDSNNNNDSKNHNGSNNYHNKTNHTKNNYTKYVTQAIKGANHHISYHIVDWYIISSFTISYIYIIIKILAYAFTFIQMRRELQGSC